MPQGVIFSRHGTQICGKRRKGLHPVDKKKPASPEGDGFPQCSSMLLRHPNAQAPNIQAFRTSAHLCSARFPLTQLLAHEVDTDQKQRQ